MGSILGLPVLTVVLVVGVPVCIAAVLLLWGVCFDRLGCDPDDAGREEAR